MLDFALTLVTVMAGFVFLYTAASLAVIGLAEIIQRVILGPSGPAEGLERDECFRMAVPPVLTGLWLLMAWWWGLGMAI